MNSKLRNILNKLHFENLAHIGQTHSSDDIHVLEAEKAIRQAVGEEMLGLLPDKDYRFNYIDDFHEAVEEIRQKIKQWQGGE